jgi:hypothetical protein
VAVEAVVAVVNERTPSLREGGGAATATATRPRPAVACPSSAVWFETEASAMHDTKCLPVGLRVGTNLPQTSDDGDAGDDTQEKPPINQ